MATTYFKSLHTNAGQTVSVTLKKRVEYVLNPDKTEDGLFVSTAHCQPESADLEFLIEQLEYEKQTGRNTTNKSVLAYHMRQAFKPGEISPELANQLGRELAERITKGHHAYVVATHTDKAHIHNHIVFNAVRTDGQKKFRDFRGSAKAVQRISDRLCLENGLSVVEPKEKGKSYDKAMSPSKRTYRGSLAEDIRDVLATEKPKTFEVFLTILEARGYEIKRGKHLAFRHAGDGNERFLRLRSMGEMFSEDNIKGVIAGTFPLGALQLKSSARAGRTRKLALQEQPNELQLLIDIQQKLNEGKGKGYEYWAKIYNLKLTAQTLNFIVDHKLNYDLLTQKSQESAEKFHVLDDKIKVAEKRMGEIAVLKTHIINYSKTRQVYIDYRKAGYSKKFYESHQAEIDLHKKSKDAFAAYTKNGIEKLPTVKMLSEEYAALLAEKKSVYSEYAAVKKEMHDVLNAKANVDKILGGQLQATIQMETKKVLSMK